MDKDKTDTGKGKSKDHTLTILNPASNSNYPTAKSLVFPS